MYFLKIPAKLFQHLLHYIFIYKMILKLLAFRLFRALDKGVSEAVGSYMSSLLSCIYSSLASLLSSMSIFSVLSSVQFHAQNLHFYIVTVQYQLPLYSSHLIWFYRKWLIINLCYMIIYTYCLGWFTKLSCSKNSQKEVPLGDSISFISFGDLSRRLFHCLCHYLSLKLHSQI